MGKKKVQLLGKKREPESRGGSLLLPLEGQCLSLVPVCVCVCVCVCESLSHVQLCNLMNASPPGSSVHGILQSRILEWVAIPFSRGLPDPGIKPEPLVLQADSLPSEPPGKVHAKRPHGLSKARLHPQEPKNLRC